MKKKRILHLVDDVKFIDTIVAMFDECSEIVSSDYVILEDNKLEIFEYVKNLKRVRVVSIKSVEKEQLLKEEYDIVWVHSLIPRKGCFANEYKNKHKCKIVWSTFGWDYLRFLELPLLRTKSFFHEFCMRSWRARIMWIGRLLFSFLHLNFLFRRKHWEREFIKNVDFYSCVLEEEWPIIKRVIGGRGYPFKFHYMSPMISDDEEEHIKVSLESKEIWVGNSATPTNNFYDIFPLLKKYEEYRINVPLSYGSITNDINRYGKFCFEGRWNAIMQFLSYASFEKKMASCSVFIFGHRRQQALGNISIALRLGGCVFLDKKSPMYSHFINKGILVFPLDELKERMTECIEIIKIKQDENISKMADLRASYWNDVTESIKMIASN